MMACHGITSAAASADRTGRAVTRGIDSLTLDFHHRQHGCYAVHG
jgi:hypothetical protein